MLWDMAYRTNLIRETSLLPLLTFNGDIFIIKSRSTLVTCLNKGYLPLRHPKDKRVLFMDMSCNASYFITGKKELKEKLKSLNIIKLILSGDIFDPNYRGLIV